MVPVELVQRVMMVGEVRREINRYLELQGNIEVIGSLDVKPDIKFFKTA